MVADGTPVSSRIFCPGAKGTSQRFHVSYSAKFRRIAFSTLACTFIWTVPRVQLFSEPLMLCDDYVSASLSNMYDVYFINELRPLGGVYPMLCKTLFPDFFSSSIPLVLNAVLAGFLGTTILRLLAQFGTGWFASWILTSGFLLHPAINDFTAWNSVGFHIVACIMALSGVLLAWEGSFWNVLAGVILLAFSILSYQLFIPVAGAVALLLFVHNGCRNEQWLWRRFSFTVLSLGAAALTFVVYGRVLSPWLFNTVESGAIGSVSQVDLSGVIPQTIALYLNVFCAPLCYWLGIENAMRTWYLVVASIYAAGALILAISWWRQEIRFCPALVLMFTWLVLPFATATPLWLSSLYTDWRISMVILLPLVFVVGSMLAVAVGAQPKQHLTEFGSRSNRVTVAVAVPGLLLLAASTAYDCRLRVDDFRHDQRVIAAIRTAPERLGFDKGRHRILFQPLPQTGITLAGDELLFTEGSRVVMGYSTLSYGAQFPLYMLSWNAIRAELCDQNQVNELREPRLEECINVRVARLPYLLQFPNNSTTVVVGTEQHRSWVLLPK